AARGRGRDGDDQPDRVAGERPRLLSDRCLLPGQHLPRFPNQRLSDVQAAAPQLRRRRRNTAKVPVVRLSIYRKLRAQKCRAKQAWTTTPKALHRESPGFRGLLPRNPWVITNRAVNPERVAPSGARNIRRASERQVELLQSSAISGSVTQGSSVKPTNLAFDGGTPSAYNRLRVRRHARPQEPNRRPQCQRLTRSPRRPSPTS